VTVIALMPSERPEWFDCRFELVGAETMWNRWRSRLVPPGAPNALKRNARETIAHAGRWGGYHAEMAYRVSRLGTEKRTADVTIATAFQTALPVYFHGQGRRCYFMQHYEPLFCEPPAIAAADVPACRRESELSYRLGLEMIANSTWLANTIEREHGVRPPVCTNAIDHSRYTPPPAPLERAAGEPVVVASYGGRDAAWKGFADAAQAMRIVRRKHPDVIWRVFGSSLLPPDNPIASYEACGFLQPPRLAALYRGAHVTLCTSWYESFPLFPLEAMACGSAVVTTPDGVEDYAVHGENAIVVPPRDPEAIAAGISSLIENEERRREIARRGVGRAREFTWARAVARFESLVLGAPTPAAVGQHR
jgi:glycosyltransferase involved in cell wall biosynthesis